MTDTWKDTVLQDAGKVGGKQQHGGGGSRIERDSTFHDTDPLKTSAAFRPPAASSISPCCSRAASLRNSLIFRFFRCSMTCSSLEHSSSTCRSVTVSACSAASFISSPLICC